MARLRYGVAGTVLIAAVLLAVLAGKGSEEPSVEEYYTSLESRLRYWLLLGNARHCGLWERGTLWPFPIGKAQRAMEEKLYSRLALEAGSKVLDAGVDITPLHVESARKNVKARGLEEKVTLQLGDYHDLKQFEDNTLDGAYTMETFVHANDPAKVLSNFLRILKPGGVLVLHEADFDWDSEILQRVLRLSHCQNTLERGTYEDLLQGAGFQNITVEDLTDEVLPFWRLFGVVGAIPYEIAKILGIQDRFINIMAGVEAYRHWGQGRYISVRAVKPR